MKFDSLGYEVTSRVPFVPVRFTADDCVKDAFYFAWDMTFGRAGRHRDHRTGGIARRRNGEIFSHAFQGKLAEFAVCQELAGFGVQANPDMSRADLGVWDAGDLRAGAREISVKSTKKQGNLLLLEASDWSADGTYVHADQGSTSGLICLVRIDPSPEDLLRRRKLLYSDSCPQTILKWTVAPLSQFRYQVLGAVDQSVIRAAVRERQLIPQGAMLNGRTRIDADNYYLQVCDFRPFGEIDWRQ